MENNTDITITEEQVSKIEAQELKPVGLEKIERFLNSSFNFIFNEVTGRIEGKSHDQTVYQPITDYLLNSLTREMSKKGISCGPTLLRNLLMSNFTPVFNPFKNYFGGLSAWDGKTDHIGLLAGSVSTTNDPFWQYCFRKWLVAMVGCVLDNHVVNHTVIVLSGGQGVGKTTWILNLIPPQLRDYSYSGTINLNNKDTLVHLSECMLINMDELENLNRSELGVMKEIITKSNIRIRRPYGYSAESMPRRASFAGSVNSKEFLSDTTGNRRFLCFEVKKIEYLKCVPLDQIYAQALHLYQSGFQYWFDPTEIESINKNNEQFRSMSVEEELLLAYFEPCDIANGDWFLSTTDILNWFCNNAKINLSDASKIKLGKALRAQKFLRIKRKDRFVYALKLKDKEMEGYLERFSPLTDQVEQTQ
jgi:predicted P-loop ATPase